MNDIKLFDKNEKELGTLIQAVRIYSEDIGTEFGIEKVFTLIMRSGKRHMIEGIELQITKESRCSEKRKVVGNIGSGHY